MKLMFLAWFFIICGHAISNMAFEGKPTSKDEDFTHSDTVKHGQVNGLNVCGEDRIEEYKAEVFHSITAQRGAHGSSNNVHRPGPIAERSAASITVKESTLFLSAAMGYVSLALSLIFSL